MKLSFSFSFPPEKVRDFKHIIYNLLVENYNDPIHNTLVVPIALRQDGEVREGFRFNESKNPEKKLPELYSIHLKKAKLEFQDQSSIIIQDLYKYYLRACVELLSKYFEKRDKYTFLYDGVPLFIQGETLAEADVRLSNMKTRQRMGQQKRKR